MLLTALFVNRQIYQRNIQIFIPAGYEGYALAIKRSKHIDPYNIMLEFKIIVLSERGQNNKNIECVSPLTISSQKMQTNL